jgi:hypothetical protein
MKKVIIILCFILSSSHLFAQINSVESIDNYTAKIDSIISYDADFHTAYMVHSINFETNIRAIGKQYTTVKFYFPMPPDSVIETENDVQFLYIYKPPVKVSVEYNIAASQNNKINYYFDNSGNLVFYNYISEGAYGSEKEQYYFVKDELAKFVIQTTEGTTGKEKDFTRHDLFLSGNVQKKAKEYKKMFDELVKLEEVDK